MILSFRSDACVVFGERMIQLCIILACVKSTKWSGRYCYCGVIEPCFQILRMTFAFLWIMPLISIIRIDSRECTSWSNLDQMYEIVLMLMISLTERATAKERSRLKHHEETSVISNQKMFVLALACHHIFLLPKWNLMNTPPHWWSLCKYQIISVHWGTNHIIISLQWVCNYIWWVKALFIHRMKDLLRNVRKLLYIISLLVHV